MEVTRRQVLQNAGKGLAAFLISCHAQETLADEKTKHSSKYKTRDLSKDNEEVLLARMLFGEARNCSDLEKISVAYTAINRVNDGKKWNGETLREVILCPKQYSCFNTKDVNRKKLMNPEKYDVKSFERCLEISRGVLSGKYNDPTNGATHYFQPESTRKPFKTDKMIKIGRIKISENKFSRHEFYKEN